MSELLRKIQRLLKKPPKTIVERLWYELKAECGRLWEPAYPRLLTLNVLLRKFQCQNLEELWQKLSQRAYCAQTMVCDPDHYQTMTTDNQQRILNQATQVMEHKVDLLGSGLVSLGDVIDWQRDYKSGFVWQQQYFRAIAYTDLGKSNDVKFPWELSRMQWMMPLGQAYILTQNEIYAEKVKELIQSWMNSNPYAYSVNWACTMDVALRLIVWTWFFHVFKHSVAWQDSAFRGQFLQSLYLHGAFTARHLEKSDVNGNHYTADAAGLVFAGLFFGQNNWQNLGWQILQAEIKNQIHEDGVDFEASTPYHRLVQELFFFPAWYRLKQGLPVTEDYRTRLKKMAYFTACYSRSDGSCPVWGDADDARVLPFGEQALNDHRYLIGLVGKCFDDKSLLDLWSGSNTEIFWVYGETLAARSQAVMQLNSAEFPQGGFYIMRDVKNHIFIDCGPIGLQGRGGHGHNDLLAFEAMLDQTPLIVDAGSYVYTSDYLARNAFRATHAHNTPQIDGEEINRFIRPDYIWNLHNDAAHQVELWQQRDDCTQFVGTHSGYSRLPDPVKPVRKIALDHLNSILTIEDRFAGNNEHHITIPYHLHPDVIPLQQPNCVLLKTPNGSFRLDWESETPWQVAIEPTQISPSYGIKQDSHKIVFKHQGPLDVGLKVKIAREGLH